MNLKYRIVTLSFFFLLGCEETDSRFTILNKSSKVISFYFTKDSTLNSACNFYATGFYSTPDGYVKKEFAYIQVGKISGLTTIGDWNTDSASFDNGVAYIYVIDSANIGKGLDSLDNCNLIRKYQVTMKDLKEHNWVTEVY